MHGIGAAAGMSSGRTSRSVALDDRSPAPPGDGFTDDRAPGPTGRSTACTVVTAEFLEHQRLTGNDLRRCVQHGFPGSSPAITGPCARHAGLDAYEDGVKAPVILASNQRGGAGRRAAGLLAGVRSGTAPDDLSGLLDAGVRRLGSRRRTGRSIVRDAE